MFLKEKRENISVLPRRELSILLGFCNLERDDNPYGLSQFRYLRQNHEPGLGSKLHEQEGAVVAEDRSTRKNLASKWPQKCIKIETWRFRTFAKRSTFHERLSIDI